MHVRNLGKTRMQTSTTESGSEGISITTFYPSCLIISSATVLMATKGTRHRQGWGSSPSPSPPIHKVRHRPPQKRSVFTASDIETDDSEGTHHDRHLRKAKPHTAIEIDKDLDLTPDRPSSSRMILGPPQRRSKFRGQSDDEESIYSLREDKDNFQTATTDTEGNREILSINKTTTALLLAEEASQILGSPIINDGSTRNYWTSVTFISPVHWTNDEWERMRALTFYPSAGPVPDSNKIEDDIEKRIPDDEGLYMGDPVKLGNGNWNRLYWRLLKQNANYWFGSDGKLFCYADPYRPEPVQLFREDQFSMEDIQQSTRFVPVKLDPFLQIGNSVQPYVLEVDLGYVNFMHHPFFSKEHVLASTLQRAFETYSRRHEEKVTDRAVNKLKALREALAHIKASTEHISQELSNETSSNIREKLVEMLTQLKERRESYRAEMRKVSLARDQGHWDDKASISMVLEAWKELKSIREHQGFINTMLKLNIIELPSDPNEELENWVYDIEQDLQDIEEESEEIFDKQMTKYRAKLKRWTMKTQKNKGNNNDGNGTDESDSSSLSRRPKPPQRPSIEECKKVIEKRYKEIRRRPGEPHIVLELVNTVSITPIGQLPEEAAKEKQRRKVLKRCKVELILSLNGNEIFISKPREINADFSVFLGFKVPISFNETPELLEMELVDSETRIRTLKIPIPLPDWKTTIERCKMKKIMFFANDVIKVANSGVGSGVDFDINGKDHEAIQTKGNISVRCGWAVNAEGSIQHPLAKRESFADNGEPGADEFTRKLSTNSLSDPNDPKNASRPQKLSGSGFVPQLSSISETLPDAVDDCNMGDDINENNRFGLDTLMTDFDFCAEHAIEKSSRYKLLQLRDQGVPEFKNMKMISPFERDIAIDIFSAYERRLKEDLRKRRGDKTLVHFGRRRQIEDDFVYESNRLERIREIRLSVLQLFEKSLKQITFEDLVIEEQIPDIGTLGLNLMSYFQPRRPLRPQRKERKRIQASNLVDTKIDVIFNIVRAFNLPLRKDSDVGLITTESLTGIQLQKNKRSERGNYSTVRPFVEVWFQRKKVRTTTALGSNPTWNQELQLNLTVPNDDYSQTNLSKMDDLMFLLIYDEVPVDLLEDDRRRETDIHQRIERRWLGSITIPFSTLYTNGRIEGTFKIKMPPVLLGYEPQGMATHFGGLTMSSKAGISGPSSTSLTNKGTGSLQSQTNAFLTIFITLQPAVQPSSSLREDNATGETSEMMAFVKNWKNIFERRFVERMVRPFVMTAEGDTIICTRYMTPIQPPDGFLHEEADVVQKMEMLAHYVSLFPFVRDSTLGITDYSLWFPSDVFVGTPGGGVDDHAVLLACYFHFMNIPCWIVQECWRGQRNSKEHEKHRIDLEPLHWRTLRRK
ncbi:coiled-coil and C2 domain-containing protein 2A-like isoform X2 [Folsomia candida]|uniref:coiled-coil and C2 domain-containing protein 2A-like isoform X2 n=1 Tax=Folsomia candida TaxID=158441 RepID=UPI0016055AA1|nr:coiled-coil and C2 domain-containing protein 2A-like isoform X2 [Folsomia candida]